MTAPPDPRGAGGGAAPGAGNRPGGGGADEPPPFFGSWTRLYTVVLGWLALLVVLFYIFTAAFT